MENRLHQQPEGYLFTLVLAFKTGNSSGQLIQLLEAHGVLAPQRIGHRASPGGVDTGLFNGVGDKTHAGHIDTVTQCQMAGKADPATELTVTADVGRACNTDTAGQRTVVTDVNVMCNLHLGVDLDVVPDHRVIERAAINAGAAAHLNIVTDNDTTELFDLVPAAAIMGKSEPVATDDGTGVEDGPGANDDAVIQRYRWMNQAVVTHRTVVAYDAIGTDGDPIPQGCAGADDRMRRHRDIASQPGTVINHGRRVDTALLTGQNRSETAGQVRVAQIGIVDGQRRNRALVDQIGMQHDSRSTRAGQILQIGTIGQKGNVGGAGILKRRQPINTYGAIPVKGGTQALSEIGEYKALT